MKISLEDSLVVAISSRALFDLTLENRIFEEKGESFYADYQAEHENEILQPGAGLPLVKALLKINEFSGGRRKAEVIIVSRNNADTGIRIFNSIEHYGLDVTRAAFTSGESLAKYLHAYDVDLFLSAHEEDVRRSVESGIAAGLVYDAPAETDTTLDQIRIAFDGDSVLFSEESDLVYREHGLEAFQQHEKDHADDPLPEGPFARFLKTLSFVQREISTEQPLIRTALVTARNSPAHERVIRTLRAWNVRIDEVFFLGGLAKERVLKVFGAHIFFDDQDFNCKATASVVPTARVPSKSGAGIPSGGGLEELSADETTRE